LEATSRERRLGFLGGSFDPPHRAHLEIAKAARVALALERVHLIPAVRNPFKETGPQADFEKRMRMLKALCADESWLEVNPIEERLGNPSRTFRTVTALRSEFPESRLFWIIGADNLPGLPQWYRLKELVSLVEFIVLERPGEVFDAPPALPGLRIHRVSGPLLPISSTEIRKRLQSGQNPDNLIPESILEIIRHESLYTLSSPA
jgi:nicotinate-nucleotide adenylyltransferase